MKELDFIKIISNTLSDSRLIGDDCAYLKDLDIFITQDSLVENVHFSLKTTTPYKLGRKSIAVNISDIAASISTPKYVLISLSIPSYLDENFIEEYYKGVNDICKEYNVTVAGGDITGSDKLFISITAIGKKTSKFISSRSFAKKDDVIIATGNFGSSACGLYCLSKNINANENIINAHIDPIPKVENGLELAEIANQNIAVMDTSDGLIDALYKISEASKCSIEVDFDKIPYDKEIENIATKYNQNYKDWIFWGGEDYELIACVPEEYINKLAKNEFKVIGKVTEKSENPNIYIKNNGENLVITKEIFENKSFNHFERK